MGAPWWAVDRNLTVRHILIGPTPGRQRRSVCLCPGGWPDPKDPGETGPMTTEAAPPGTEGFLVPLGDQESDGFWEGTAAGELRVQACAACGQFRFPPRVMCPYCQSTEREWRPVSGQGTIWSFVVAHPPLLPAYAPFAPYPVITVTLAEGEELRMVGNFVTGPQG